MDGQKWKHGEKSDLRDLIVAKRKPPLELENASLEWVERNYEEWIGGYRDYE